MAAEESSHAGIQWSDIEKGGSDGKLAGTMLLTVHYARDLPKMDVGLGKIDAYVRLEVGKKKFKTKVKSKDYNPKWEETFRVNLDGLDSVPLVKFQVMDKDKLSSDDRAGNGQWQVTSLPSGARIELTSLAKKPSNKATSSCVVLSAAWMPSFSFAARVLAERSLPFEGNKKQTHLVIRPREQLGDGIAVVAEFEKDTFDLHLVKEPGAAANLFAELSLGGKHKFKVRRQEKAEPWKISDVIEVVSARKLDDLDCFTAWGEIELRTFDVELVLETKMNEISLAHGWKSGVRANYAIAKDMLENVITDDGQQALYFPLTVGDSLVTVAYLKSDFDSDNIDRAILLTEAGHAQQLVVDIEHVNTKKRVEHTWPKTTHDSGIGKEVSIVSRVSIDDIPMPCSQNDVTVRILRRTSAVRSVKLVDLLPIFLSLDKKQLKKIIGSFKKIESEPATQSDNVLSL